MAALKSPHLRMLLEHYLEARGERRMPARHDIDPLRLGPVLPIIWISDYEPAAGTFRYRLAGEKVAELWGAPVAGRLLSEFSPPERFAATNETHLKVLREEAALIACGAVFRCSGRVGLGERLILPLASDGVTADVLIGATHREPTIDVELAATSELVTTFVPVDELGRVVRAVGR
ncbi:MAG: PAS domain-containing protein [Bacteroidota bacterium]